MSLSTLIKPEHRTIACGDGESKTFVISKFPAIAGREIITQYPISAVPKLGDYARNEELMVKIMGYVAVLDSNGNELRLSTRGLIDNHVPDFECLMRLEAEMIGYNCSFFGNGKASTFLETIIKKAKEWGFRTLTEWSAQSSAKASPLSTSSEPSTTSKTR